MSPDIMSLLFDLFLIGMGSLILSMIGLLVFLLGRDAVRGRL